MRTLESEAAEDQGLAKEVIFQINNNSISNLYYLFLLLYSKSGFGKG
jgi:hypothetical protein